VKCPLCGEALVERGQVLLWQADGLAPDPELQARVREWPEDSLVRALRDHFDDYRPTQQRALVEEAARRGLPVPARRVGGRSVLDRIAMAAALALGIWAIASVLLRLVR
jgi:hypothetical protein